MLQQNLARMIRHSKDQTADFWRYGFGRKYGTERSKQRQTPERSESKVLCFYDEQQTISADCLTSTNHAGGNDTNRY